VIKYYYPFGYLLVFIFVVGEPTNYFNMEAFLLKAKANWELTCIAGGFINC
jgi:hypothetical protein